MKILMHKNTHYLMATVLILLLFLGSTVFAEQTIKIGIIGPMKFVPGEHILWSGSLATEEINERGGVAIKGNKYKIELIKADSNEILSLPDAVRAMERLIIENKVNFIIGGFNSEPVLAMQEVMADNKILFLCPGSSHVAQCERLAKDYNKYKYFFRVGPPNTEYTGLIVAHQFMMYIEAINKKLGVKKPKVALLSEKGLWAEECISNAAKAVPKEMFENVGRWAVSRTAPDVNAEMTAIKAAAPHIILYAVSGPAGVPISKAWGELSIPAILCGMNVPSMSLAHWQATNGLCNYETNSGTIGRVEITEKTVPFYDKMVEKIKQNPSYIAGDTYDAVYVLKDAIERANSLETEAVLTSLEKTDYRGVMGRINFFPKGHKWPHDLVWGPGYVTWVGTQWRDGKIMTVWPDGNARLGEAGFKGFKYKGTVDYELPPWMVKYWRGK